MRRESGLLYLSITRRFLEKIHRGEWQPGQQIPGIRELAVSFSASVKTVSRALEELDNRGLLERTRGRGIFLLPRELWPRQKEAPLVYLTPSGGNPVNLSLIPPMAEELSRAGRELIIHTYENLNREQFLPRIPQPCGGILAMDFVPPQELFSLLAREPSDLPLLYMGGFLPPVDFRGSYLIWDLEEGLERITDYLIDQGRQRIGYLGGLLPLDRDPGFLALRRVFQRRGLAIERNFCQALGGYGSPEGHRVMEDMMKADDGTSLALPSAFISLYDGIAAGAMAAIQEAGRKIPGDIAFVECENSEVARTIRPSLTSLSLERESAAALAGKLLDLSGRGRAGQSSPVGIKIPLLLEERGSTQPDDGESIDRWV